ncbi:MptD family putative ECF transporter S component [Anaerococcus sp. NML200537]|uniref:MptD family putative ECF transporter S component n=1 Tax=Anaerococcus sp. NML200537 TaxID=2954485 RepID=UPI002238CCFE|nr:MptD family putative ECF transporter S component [Anaerococcus sp. NML200537]MCW6701329.1 MptD family putative ECF transporter S component [Anaerococcus sp. NML200537]
MNKFGIRDLVNAGVFSLLTVMATWCGGMIGFVPVLMPLVPFACGLVSGPIFMLYSTKINKFGMVLIMGIIFGLVFSMSGHGAIVLPAIIILSIICEFILKTGSYKSIKTARVTYTVFMMFAAANLIPMYLARDSYAKSLIDQGYGEAYVEKLLSVMPTWSFLPVVILGMIGGYLGCTIGIKVLNKHFKKAGMA